METNLNNIIGKAMQSVNSSIKKDELIQQELNKYKESNDTPMLIYESFFHHRRYKDILDRHIDYRPPNWLRNGMTACIDISSNLYQFNDSRYKVKVATRELAQEIRAIDKQIKELEHKKYELINTNWNKCKKLGIQTAQEYADIKKSIIDDLKAKGMIQ